MICMICKDIVDGQGSRLCTGEVARAQQVETDTRITKNKTHGNGEAEKRPTERRDSELFQRKIERWIVMEETKQRTGQNLMLFNGTEEWRKSWLCEG